MKVEQSYAAFQAHVNNRHNDLTAPSSNNISKVFGAIMIHHLLQSFCSKRTIYTIKWMNTISDACESMLCEFMLIHYKILGLLIVDVLLKMPSSCNMVSVGSSVTRPTWFPKPVNAASHLTWRLISDYGSHPCFIQIWSSSSCWKNCECNLLLNYLRNPANASHWKGSEEKLVKQWLGSLVKYWILLCVKKWKKQRVQCCMEHLDWNVEWANRPSY